MNIIATDVQVLPLKYLQENVGQIEGVPANPRILRDARYKSLLESLKTDNLIGVNPLKIYELKKGEYVVLGGNMRLKALRELHDDGYAVSCIMIPKDTPADVLRKIVILDNSTFGEWDWDMLANEWEAEELKDWGVDVPKIIDESSLSHLFDEAEGSAEKGDKIIIEVPTVFGDIIDDIKAAVRLTLEEWEGCKVK